MTSSSEIPLAKITRLGGKALLHRDLFNVSWVLGRFCNYKCSYCWPHGRSDQRDYRPVPLILQTMAEIKRQARERSFNSFHFSFTGGEPTFHPGFLEIAKAFADDAPNTRFSSLHISSNCSPGIKFFEKYVHAVQGVHQLSVGASFHHEFAKKEEFRDKMVFLRDSGVLVTINLVMKPSRFDELHEIGKYFHEKNLHVSLKPQSNATATAILPDYTAEQLQIMSEDLHAVGVDTSHSPEDEFTTGLEMSDRKGRTRHLDHAERLNALGFNQFSNWICEAGFRSLIIREPCGSIKRGHSCYDQPLGNIESGFRLFDKPAKCVTKQCLCSADLKIPKCREPKSLRERLVEKCQVLFPDTQR